MLHSLLTAGLCENASRKMAVKPTPSRTRPAPFDLHAFLESAGLSRRNVRFKRDATVFAQGTAANDVFYIQSGSVKLSVVSSVGKEAWLRCWAPEIFSEKAA